jgi:hypothetical protein
MRRIDRFQREKMKKKKKKRERRGAIILYDQPILHSRHPTVAQDDIFISVLMSVKKMGQIYKY